MKADGAEVSDVQRVITPYPASLSVDYPERPLDRLTTFFRIFTVIPIAVILGLVEGSALRGSGSNAANSYQFAVGAEWCPSRRCSCFSFARSTPAGGSTGI